MKVFKRVTSYCLVFVMLFVYYLATPVKALAESAERAEAIETYADATNDFSANTELEYSPLVGEEEANREEFIKVFRRADGAREAVIYTQPIHYLRNGEWETIDNTLELVTLEDGSKIYRNKANDFVVSFAELFSSDQLVTIESADKSLSWRFIGAEEPIPTPTPTPEPTSEPIVTPEPIITLEPIVTPEPIIEIPVEPVPDSEISSTPEDDTQMESDSIPEIDLEATEEPEADEIITDQREPDTTEEPALELEVVPEATSEPVITPEPIDTPDPTTAPTPEATPEPTVEPTPEPTAEPEATAEPTIEPTIEPIAEEETVFDTLIVSDAEASLVPATSTVSDEDRDMQLRFPSQLTSEIVYTDPTTGLNVRYVLSGKSLREYITLESAPARAVAYTVEITADGITPVTDENGKTFFVDPEGKNIFSLGDAVMFDAAGAESNAIEAQLYEVDIESNTYTYMLIPDLEWLQSEERQYPLSIDPDISISISDSIQDTYVASAHKNSNYSTGQSMNIGGTAAEGLVYIPNSILPKISSGDVILNACLYLTRYNSNSSYTNASSVIYEATSSWDASTVTWNTKPSYNTAPGSVSYGISSVRYKSNPFDITRTVQKWYEDESNNLGLVFKGTGSSSLFCTSEYTGSASRKPYLSIVYVNTTGLEDSWTYYSQNIGRAGTGSVNIFSGNLTLTHADAAINNGILPISLSHVFNMNDSLLDIGYGTGWRLNYAQSLNKVVLPDMDSTVTYYRYTDGDGTRHYYKAKDGSTTEFVNELNKDFVLTLDGATATISDKADNQLVFTCDSAVENGRLTAVRDANGNETIITYTTDTITDLKIASITEKLSGNETGQTLSLSYEDGRLTAVDVPDGLDVSYSYMDGNLTSITYADNKSVSYAYARATDESGMLIGNKLVSATNIDNYSISYAYTNDAPYRVTRISETAGSTDGQHLEIAYGRNKAVVTDAQERRTVYQMDNNGQAVSVTDPNGRAVFAAYGSSGQERTQLTAVSKMQSSILPLLKNHGFELDSYPKNWTRSNSDAIVTSEVAIKHTGYRACRMTASSSSARTLTQDTSVIPGTAYTLSAYFTGVAGYLQVTDGSNIYQTDPIKSQGSAGENWERGILTFTPQSSTVTVAIVLPAGSGKMYVDSVQLEKGEVPNRYNMIENGDLSLDVYGFDRNYTTHTSVVDVSAASFEAARTSHPSVTSADSTLDSKVYQINADVGNSYHLTQTIAVGGPAGDVYSFGGWSASNCFPLTKQNVYYGSNGASHVVEYGIRRLTVNFLTTNGTVINSAYAYFGADTNEWQYASGVAVAQQDYSQVQLVAECKRGGNTMYVDGLQLYKEEFATAYSYDDNGNLTGTTSLIGQQNVFDYDDNDNVTSSTDPRGNTTTYTYDDHHNLLTSTSPEGVVTSNTYNDFGLPTETKVGTDTNYIRTTTAYDGASGIAISETDARGSAVLTQYNAATRLATEITDAKNNSTAYGYDSLNRVSSITSGDSGVSYTYANDKLTQVDVDGAVFYGLTYDGFGRTISTKAGSSADSMTALATNTYNNDTGLLTQTQYGNGFTVSYVYDNLDRVTEVKYNGMTVYKYVYDGSGNLYSACDVALGFTIYYEYDHTDRCVKSFTKDNATGAILSSYSYQYDVNNNLTKLTCSTGGTTWATTYAYDADNRPTMATLESGKTITNTYDAIGRLSIRAIGDYTTTLSYLAGTNGSQTAMVASYQNGTDAAYQYTYDANGNITHIQQGDSHIYYQYDNLNQLVREDNSVLNKSITYTYDDRGNILNKTEYAYVANGGTLGAATDTVTYGYESEYQGWADQLTWEAIRYDASGNPTTYRGYTMTWNGRQLATATNGTNTVSYSYDENGIRTKKTVNGVTTNYNYHGSVLISQVTGDDTLLFSYDASGNAAAVNFNGTYYYYVRNGQGDIVKLIDNSGATVVEYAYDSWGKQLSCTGSLAGTLGTQNPFRYRGYIYDTETGLYYLQTRYYDPEVGRFINADIYVSTGQSVLGNNMYLYCGNNPVTRADDEGDFWNIVVGAVVGAVFSVAAQVINNAIQGENLLDGVGTAALTGAASGALAASGVGLVVSVVGNAAISMAGNAANQVIRNKGFDNFDVGDMLIDGAIGAVSGRVGGKGMGKFANLKTLNKNLTKKVISGSKETIKQGVKYYVSQTKFAYKEYLVKPIFKSTATNVLGQTGLSIWEMY